MCAWMVLRASDNGAVLDFASCTGIACDCLILQRDPKGIAKKNGAQLSHRDDIFSQLAPILRSAGTSEVRLVLNAVWTRARPCAAH